MSNELTDENDPVTTTTTPFFVFMEGVYQPHGQG